MKYFIYLNQQQIGPLSIEELGRYNIVPQTRVWRDDQENWKEAKDFKELIQFLPYTESNTTNTIIKYKKFLLLIPILLQIITLSTTLVEMSERNNKGVISITGYAFEVHDKESVKFPITGIASIFWISINLLVFLFFFKNRKMLLTMSILNLLFAIKIIILIFSSPWGYHQVHVEIFPGSYLLALSFIAYFIVYLQLYRWQKQNY